MSSDELARVLRVIVCAVDLLSYCDGIRALGHQVVRTFSNSKELALAIPSLESAPNVVIMDTAEADELTSIQSACASRSITVPIIIISKDLDKISVCQGLDIVFGVCSMPPVFDNDTLRAVLLVAMARFETEVKWRFAADEAVEQLESTKMCHRACSIMFDYGRAPTLVDAYKLLQEIASSNNRTLLEQAQTFLDLDQATRPREKRHTK